MKHKAEGIPIACRLCEPELRHREATLFAQFKSAIVSTEELSGGYLFHLPGDRHKLALIVELMAVERECCPFLAFELAVLPNLGPLEVRVTGPDGSKEFLRALFEPNVGSTGK